jgi:hypothetical protein
MYASTSKKVAVRMLENARNGLVNGDECYHSSRIFSC